jgi:serine/threonine protein kinase
VFDCEGATGCRGLFVCAQLKAVFGGGKMPAEVKKGTELRDRYVVSDLIGMGGFATVWRATDKQAGRDVAIKRLLKISGNDLARLLDEGRKTSKLKGHKNIVEVHAVFELDGEGFLVMEYVDGSSLDELFRQHIRTRTWVDREEGIDYFKQILQGLLFAHSSGLYHRDIKPSNILVSKLGVIKLVDFGLAKPMLTGKSDSDLRDPGVAWTGTPNFMSSEQAKGEDLDHQTDIFSAGLVGHILLAARHPFNHPSGVATVFELIKDASFECGEATDYLGRALPEEVSRVLVKMLKKNKSDRYQSLVEPLNELAKEAAQSCSRCGAPNPKTNSFCGQCGQSLKAPASVAETLATNLLKDKLPLSAEDLTDEGFAMTKQGDWLAAIGKYVSATEADPTYARAYSNLGFALNRLGKFDEGIEYLSKGILFAGDAPQLHRLYDNRGFAKSNLKDYEGAISDFTKAIELNPSNPRVYYHRAESHAQAENYEEAYSDVQIALRLDPDFESALRLRKRLQMQGLVKGFRFLN